MSFTKEQIETIEASTEFTGYYYNDHVSGLRKEFNYLHDAIREAIKEYGHYIEIKFKHNGVMALLVHAAGFIPA